jgi:hypothetical protein
MAILAPINVRQPYNPPPPPPPPPPEPPVEPTSSPSGVVSTYAPKTIEAVTSVVKDVHDQAAGFEDTAKGIWNNVSQYLKNWTPIQKVVNETNSGGAVSTVGRFLFQPGQNFINLGTSLSNQGSARPAQDYQGRWYVRNTPGMKLENALGKGLQLIGKTESQTSQVVKDVVMDATIGGAYQGLKATITGQQPKLVDVLPGASAFASFNPKMAEGYNAAQNTNAGKLFANSYLVALNAAQLGAVASSAVGVLKGSGPLAWGGKIVNTGNLLKAGAGITGMSALGRTIRATNRGTSATKAQTDEYKREYSLSHTKSEGGSLPDPVVQETLPTVIPPTQPGAVTNNYTTTTTPAPSPNPVDKVAIVKEWLNSDEGKSMWDAVMAGAYTKSANDFVRTLAGMVNNQSGSVSAGPSAQEQYGGGSGGPTRMAYLLKSKTTSVGRKKKLPKRQSRSSSVVSSNSKPAKLARTAIQTP